MAYTYLWIMAISYGGYGLVMSTCAAFNGSGYPLPAVVISSLRTIIVFVPLALFGQWLHRSVRHLHGLGRREHFDRPDRFCLVRPAH